MLRFASRLMSRVEKRRSGGSLPVAIGVAFRHAASVRFDLVLFPLPDLPVMSKVLELFRDNDDWQKAFWFGSANSYLKNKMPKELLKSHPNDVLNAAELEAIGAQHG